MASEVITANELIPYNIIGLELDGTLKTEFTGELERILKLYYAYDNGADFTTEGTNGDYIASKLRYKQAKSIINKESRFLFANKPDITLHQLDIDNKEDADKVSNWQATLDAIFKKNKLPKKLLAASKDCLIGKRVLGILNFNESGVRINFLKSTEFYYETDPCDVDVITKVFTFQTIRRSQSTKERRIFFKKYWMENGMCHSREVIYDGAGREVEVITDDITTKFTYIPAFVVINDGLSGETEGDSEIEPLLEYESQFSKLANADVDAERKSMNPVRYTMNCSPESTANLSSAAGAFWDLATDPTAPEGASAEAGVLESTMSYKDALKNTLDRIKNTMYEQVDVPNVSSEALQGVVTSGKTLKAIYWGLMVRCDEKMLAWAPELEFMTETIIEGLMLYPESAIPYTTAKLEPVEMEVLVENNYPLPEDEAEEKTIDLAEVAGQTRSKKSYMKKWMNLTDDEINEELSQIAAEREQLEDAFTMPNTMTGSEL